MTTNVATAARSAALITRHVTKAVLSRETPEGQGATVRRSIGSPALRNLSPFLMLDHITSIPEHAGFPDHPHRGQATVTYLLEGSFQHEDFLGNSGILGPGDLQWMSAGRGILHSEMPLHRDAQGNKLPEPVGLQLWIDLPAAAKKLPPTYQEHSKDKVPTALPRGSEPVETEGQGWTVKVIAGQSHGVTSPVRTPENGSCHYFDIRLAPGGRVFEQIPTGFTAFIYTLKGNILVGADEKGAPSPHAQGPNTVYPPFHALVLSNLAQVKDPKVDLTTVPQENGVWIDNAGDEEAHLVLIAGQPLDQEVFQYGPFVLTSRAEVQQTLIDYQRGENGFENAPGWKSKIGIH